MVGTDEGSIYPQDAPSTFLKIKSLQEPTEDGHLVRKQDQYVSRGPVAWPDYYWEEDSASNITKGTASGVAPFKLIDTLNDFVAAGVEPGMFVYNKDTPGWAEIISVDGPTMLTLTHDILTAPENYDIGTTAPDGNVHTLDLTPIVGSNARMVHLSTSFRGKGKLANKRFQMVRHGDGVAPANVGGAMKQLIVGSIYQTDDAWVPLNDGKIDYTVFAAPGEIDELAFVVVGWF